MKTDVFRRAVVSRATDYFRSLGLQLHINSFFFFPPKQLKNNKGKNKQNKKKLNQK